MGTLQDERDRRRRSRAAALCSCTGYRVDSVTGERGVVEHAIFGKRLDRPDYLLVRGGLFRHRREQIPVEQVVSIDPERRRLLVLARDSRRCSDRCDP